MSAVAVAALATLAVVAQDGTALRAAARDSAPTQAVLVPGDLLEVRGQRIDHLQVWDHRRERGGYVRAAQVRVLPLGEAEVPQLRAVARFLRDTPGAESLGIAYVAAVLRAAPAQTIDAEVFDLLGTMAERLADRAGAARPGSASLDHLEAARQYGVAFRSVEQNAAVTLCYDGDAFRRVLTLPATAEQQAHAVLALTRADCVGVQPGSSAHAAVLHDHAALLDRLRDVPLPETTQQQLQLRSAAVLAALAWDRARLGQPAPAEARRALDAFAAVQPDALNDRDQRQYQHVAVQLGATRWAAEPPPPVGGRHGLQVDPGERGQTCVRLGDSQRPLVRRCTWGVVWLASARQRADGQALALAVQPLPGWTELWLFRATAEGWTVQVLPPAAGEPGLGTVEFAGWVAGADKLLVAREARVDTRLRRSFEVLALDSLATEKQASQPQLLAAFAKWQDPTWRAHTLLLR